MPGRGGLRVVILLGATVTASLQVMAQNQNPAARDPESANNRSGTWSASAGATAALRPHGAAAGIR